MKKNSLIFGIISMAAAALCAGESAYADEFSLPADYSRHTVFDSAVFYDGYLTNRIVDADADDGILRFTNYHYSRKVNVDEVLALGNDLQLEVIIGALCDNYDRMGRVMLAFPEAGSSSYDPESTERIEIARFITPFMNRNRKPAEVPYIYEIDDIRQLLADKGFLAGKDVWVEAEVFGIPYAAQKQVAGCAGHDDVFAATVSFGGHLNAAASPTEAESGGNTVLTPINVSKCEIHGNVNFNNYRAEATDTIGVTTKTYTFEVPEDLSDARINLILTNHGAAEDGEEYERRQHLVYIDGEIAMVYTPGGVSCEPYRKYNTQGNGIYGSSRPEGFWDDWSNWCPGQAVPIRHISLGSLKAGEHKLMIRVPEAAFVGNDGDFRPSAYLLGVRKGTLVSPSEVETIIAGDSMGMTLTGRCVAFSGEEEVAELMVYSFDGRLMEGHYRPGDSYSFAHLPAGQYIIVAVGKSGKTSFVKAVN